MSLYNMMNGVNPATFFVLPMLGKHPNEYPRFKDCFVGELSNSLDRDQFGIPLKAISDDDVISVHTRVGGGNRSDYANEIEALRNAPGFVRDYDDDFDSTFATFVFRVPHAWSDDFELVKAGKLTEVSDAYRLQLVRVYPKLTSKLEEIFGHHLVFDRDGKRVTAGSRLSVQDVPEPVEVYESEGDLYFQPYGKPERVREYFSDDIWVRK